MRIYNIVLTGVAAGLIMSGIEAKAQAPADTYRNAIEGLSGTARAQAMGGAVGAMGADPSAILINPAGSALYRRGIISIGMQGSRANSNVNWQYENDQTGIKNRYNLGDFNNITYVSSPFLFGKGGISDWQMNWGLQYNSDYDYTRNYRMQQILPPSNLSAYIANRANQGTATPKDYYLQTNNNGQITYDPRFQPLDQIVVMGMNGELIEGADGENKATYRPNTWVRDKNGQPKFLLPDATLLDVREKGGKSTFDINVGFGYQDRFYLGASLRTSTISYSRNSVYDEDYFDKPSNTEIAVAYNNELRTSGTTIGLNIGGLMAIGDWGRIGISYLLPQYGSFEDNYYVSASFSTEDPAKGKQNFRFDSGDEYLTSSYTTLMPGKLTVSAMAFLSEYGMVTYDLQYRNLGNSRLTTNGINNSGVNEFIKEDYGQQLSHRVGLEIRPLRMLSLRAGYSYTGSGLKAEPLKSEEAGGTTYEYIPSGTIVDYTLPENYQTYSAGIGLRLGRSTSFDFAWVHGVRNERVYAHPGLPEVSNTYGNYPAVKSVGGKMKSTENRLVGTLTFSF